jgi:two-component system, OmpR family, phosphate regulon response regulator PhoB
VLVVDDDQTLCDLLADLLDEEGYAVECLPDGRRALARLEAGAVDLALLDLKLPGVDGLEVCRRLRAQEATRGGHVPVVVLTASADLGHEQAIAAAGADDHLAKPFELDALLSRVRHWLPGR